MPPLRLSPEIYQQVFRGTTILNLHPVRDAVSFHSFLADLFPAKALCLSESEKPVENPAENPENSVYPVKANLAISPFAKKTLRIH